MVKMTTDVGLQSPNARDARLAGGVSDPVLAERAQRATKAFRQMQPMLTGFAKAVTRRNDVRVVLAPGTPCTDGKIIYMRPPVELGEVKRHDRSLCDRREFGELICEACRAREEIMVILYHEIAHMTEGSFEEVPDWEKREAVDRALKERRVAASDVRAEQIRRTIENAPWDMKRSYLGLSRLVSPYLPVLVNALEDARVNKAMYSARPGVKVMFENWARRLMHEGRKEFDGTVHKWADAPRNIQVVIGLFAKASGYDYHTEGWFSDEVVAALDDTQLTQLLWKLEHQVRSASGVYQLAFPVLERLRQLGFCRQPDEEDEPEPQPQPEGKSEDKSDDDGSEGEPEEGLSGSEGTPQDSERDDDDDSTDDAEGSSGGEDHAADPEAGEAGEDHDSDPGDGASGSADDDDVDSDDSGSDEGSADGETDEGASEGTPDGRGGDSPVDDSDPASGDAGSSEGDEDGEEGAGGLTGTGDISGPTMPEDEPADERRGSDTPGSPDIGSDEGDGSDSEPGEGDDGDEYDDGLGEDGMYESPEQDQPTRVISDPERDGTADEVEEALKEFGGHAEPRETVRERMDREDMEKEMDRAIVQAAWFETPSSNIFGVRVHKFDKHYELEGDDLSIGWTHGGHFRNRDRYTLGIEIPKETPEPILGPALLKTRKAFHDNKRADKQKNLKSGRIDARVLGRRAATDDPRLFAKRRLPGKRDYFVVIGIDVSASTTGRNLNLAKQAAHAQAELLSRAGIDFAMYAHSGSPDAHHGTSVDIYVLKEEGEPWDSRIQERLFELGPVSANLDGHTMEFYRKVCDTSNATDKIIMYYTDGKMPAENYTEELEILTREIRTCKQRGYTLMGVGIRTDSPLEHGLDTVQIDDIEDLGKVVTHLAKRLTVIRH